MWKHWGQVASKLKHYTWGYYTCDLNTALFRTYLSDETVCTDKLSRGEICMANFIPPANGASLGSF